MENAPVIFFDMPEKVLNTFYSGFFLVIRCLNVIMCKLAMYGYITWNENEF